MKGVICVERKVDGQMVVMPIEDQKNYKEWIGCFSLLV